MLLRRRFLSREDVLKPRKRIGRMYRVERLGLIVRLEEESSTGKSKSETKESEKQ